MKSGIYKITNLINGKIYIGSTCSFRDRKSKHKNRKNNTLISKSIFKYGWENFKFEVIEYCDTDILIEREQFYLDTYQPFVENNGYNLLRRVEKSWLGYKHTDESKKKMSEKKRNCIPWNKGKTGVQICSVETRRLMSENRSGEKNGFFGKSHSKRTIDRLSESAKNRDMSLCNKMVLQLDKVTGEIIKIWESISEAAEFLTGDKSQSTRISRVCRGKNKTSMGFRWEYLKQ